MGITVEELLKEAGRVFGAARVTGSGRARLTLGLDQAVRAELLRVAGGVVMPQ